MDQNPTTDAVRVPQDAFKAHPPPPRSVTVEPSSPGWLRREITYPDGSGSEEKYRDPDAPAPAPAEPPGAAAAARRLAAAHAGRLRHDGAGWWAFDGTLWRRRAPTREIDAALREAGVAAPWPALLAATEGLARTEPALAGPADWDADPLLLGTPGGTVDLRTGTLRPAAPADAITRSTAVAPADGADCPLWRRFLAEATGGDDALQNFLQRWCGYGLTGETCEHAFLFLHGAGGNGKSVFGNTLHHLLGTYAAVAAPDLFTAGGGAELRGRAAESAAIAELAGARLVVANETEENRFWADGRLKRLTGGDPVTARLIGGNSFTFTPRLKLLVTGNHRPALRTADAALRRRLHLVPLAHQPAAPDRRLAARLRDEGPAILRWMIEGCLAWAADGGNGGLARPAAVATATAAYLDGEDGVAQFLAECCDRDPHFLETAADLYAAWCAHAAAAGEPAGTQRRFAAGLERLGLTRERAGHARFYRGVRLLRVGERIDEVYRVRKG